MTCAHRTGTGHYLFSTISSRHLDVARSPAPTLGAHTLVRLFVQFRVLSKITKDCTCRPYIIIPNKINYRKIEWRQKRWINLSTF